MPDINAYGTCWRCRRYLRVGANALERVKDTDKLQCSGLLRSSCDRIAGSREKVTRAIVKGAQSPGGKVPGKEDGK